MTSSPWGQIKGSHCGQETGGQQLTLHSSLQARGSSLYFPLRLFVTYLLQLNLWHAERGQTKAH
jgi:hypothetical protein